MPIPKIIHQTFSTSIIPHQLQKYQFQLRSFHPDWEYRFYDDAQCDQIICDYLPDFLETYRGYKYAIQKADFFRIAVVYLFGGFYADLDIKILKPLDPLETYSCIFPLESNKTLTIGNYMFGSEAKHPFLQEVLNQLNKNCSINIFSDNDVLISTGPGMITNLFSSYKDIDKVTILENRFGFCNHPSCNSVSCHFGEFAIHLHVGGWRKSKPFLIQLSKNFYVSFFKMLNKNKNMLFRTYHKN